MKLLGPEDLKGKINHVSKAVDDSNVNYDDLFWMVCIPEMYKIWSMLQKIHSNYINQIK